MAVQPRVAKVLMILLISMTAGTIVLMAMESNTPLAGPFCLSSYYRLGSVEKAIHTDIPQSQGRWDSIEVYYSQTGAGNIEQLTVLAGLPSHEDINCHFVICNGLGGADGQIQTTEKWKKQWVIMPGNNWFGDVKTIRICIVADGKDTKPSDFQVKRIEALTEELCRKFEIRLESIRYPENW